jgi:hypothetical protein
MDRLLTFSILALRVVALALVFGLVKIASFLSGGLSNGGLAMGATAFSKQETVFFDQLMAGFDDLLMFGRNVSIYNADPTVLERSQGLAFWRPVPYVSVSVNGAAGTDISASFTDMTQLSVPIALGFDKSVPWAMTSNDLNDPQQRERKLQSAMQRLATDINVACANVAALNGTLIVKRTVAASGFDDLAAADSLMTEQGLVGDSPRRVAVLHARDYNSMASTLAKPATSANDKVNNAYENAFVGRVSGFDTFKSDYTYRLTAALGVTVTVNGAGQFYTPKATSTAGTGEIQNVDNRYQTLPITVTSGTVKVGDKFTITGVNACHHISKQDTGQLKTFTITQIITGAGGTGTVQISPPIISGGGATQGRARVPERHRHAGQRRRDHVPQHGLWQRGPVLGRARDRTAPGPQRRRRGSDHGGRWLHALDHRAGRRRDHVQVLRHQHEEVQVPLRHPLRRRDDQPRDVRPRPVQPDLIG